LLLQNWVVDAAPHTSCSWPRTFVECGAEL